MKAKTYANIKGAQAEAKKADAPAPALTTVAPAAAVKEVAPKVERVQQNGVKRPAPGGVCAAVWGWLDTNPGATVKDAKAVAPVQGWNPNNVACEFYAWRKFQGITGRAKAA